MMRPRIGIMGGIAAIAVGIGVAAAGIGHLLRSVPTAQAAEGIGPTVTGGVHPWVNLSGIMNAAVADTVIYTVPADRLFVMTGGCVYGTSNSLMQDGDVKVHLFTRLLQCDNISSSGDDGPSLLREGNAHIVFDPGSQVILHADALGGWRYYFEGYLARP